LFNNKKLIGLEVCILVIFLGISVISIAKTTIEWEPIAPRIVSQTYTLPQGAEQVITESGAKKMVVYNWGGLEYDPATVKNGKIFTDLTGVDIEFVGYPDDQMYPKLQSIFLAKSPSVDIVPLDATLYIAFVQAGWLEPLDFLWTEEAWEQFSPGLRGAIDVEGHVYCVPQVARILTALYYRPSILKEAGFDGPPKTWAEFDEMAKKLTIDKDGDGVIDQYGYAFSGGGVQDGAYTLMTNMYLLGEKVVQDDGSIVFNSPNAVKALERLVKMRNEWKVVPQSVTSYAHGDTEDLFKGGKVAMIIEPTSFYADVTADSSPIADDVGITVQPVAYESGPTTTNLEINMWGVSSFSKNKEAAFAFCDYYRSKQAAVNELCMEANESWNLSVLSDDTVINSLKVDYLNVIKGALKDTRTELFANQAMAYKIVITEIQNALVGNKTAKEALNAAQAQIDEEFGQN